MSCKFNWKKWSARYGETPPSRGVRVVSVFATARTRPDEIFHWYASVGKRSMTDALEDFARCMWAREGREKTQAVLWVNGRRALTSEVVFTVRA